MIRPDFYEALGLNPTASTEDIRQAFRLLARQYHPDTNPNDPTAAERFKIINEAYRILGSPQSRAAYDQALRIVSPGIVSGPTIPSRVGVPPQPNSKSSVTPPVDGSHIHSTGAKTMPGFSGASSLTPALGLRVILAQNVISPPRDVTRFYFLSEMGASHEAAIIEPLPLDLALVIDRSTSMRGEKIVETKRAVLNLLDQLRPDDLLTLVFFDDRAEVVADGETIRGRAGIENAISNQTPRGSTEIANGLSVTLERLAARQNRTRIAALILLTDGKTYGDEARCLELAAHARDLGVSITCLGMDADWNRELLDRLAAIGGGSCNYVERPAELQGIFEETVQRLRATLAASMRLTFEPAPGVRVSRATRVAPDITEAFGNPSGVLTAAQSGPVTVDLGALTGRPEAESVVVTWEALLDPASLTHRNGAYDIGRLVATYWTPLANGGQVERLERLVTLPISSSGQQVPIAPEVRLALELITAYRLQTQADSLQAAGARAEASMRMNTAALRLESAGYGDLALQARQAAVELNSGPTGVASVGAHPAATATLRAKYGTKNLSLFHRRRRALPAN